MLKSLGRVHNYNDFLECFKSARNSGFENISVDLMFGLPKDVYKRQEIYFEEDDFDKFTERLSKLEIDYLHKVYEHRWGQRVVRFYDPDKHLSLIHIWYIYDLDRRPVRRVVRFDTR